MKALGEKGRSISSSTSIKPRKLSQGVNQLLRDSFHLIYRKIPLIYWHYKIFCVNGKYGIQVEFRIFYFIALQNEEDYERKESSSA